MLFTFSQGKGFSLVIITYQTEFCAFSPDYYNCTPFEVIYPQVSYPGAETSTSVKALLKLLVTLSQSE